MHDEAKLPDDTEIHLIKLIACGVAKGEKPDYLVELATDSAWGGSGPTEVVAWQAYVTLFDVRHLVRMLEQDPRFRLFIETYAGASAAALARSGAEEATSIVADIDNPKQQRKRSVNKAFGNERDKQLRPLFQRLTQDQVFGLIGRLVAKEVGSNNYFSRMPSYLPSSNQLFWPDPKTYSKPTRPDDKLLAPLTLRRDQSIQDTLYEALLDDLIRLIIEYLGQVYVWQYDVRTGRVALLKQDS
jgi:hypothetical protein